MKKRDRLFLLSIATSCMLLCGTSSTQAASAPVTFWDAFQSAKSQTEVLKIQTELTEQVEAKKDQIVGGVLPTINAVGSYSLFDVPNGLLLPKNPSAIRLTASQAVFRGFREYAGIRQYSRLVDSQRISELTAAMTLYQSVGVSFFRQVEAEADLRNLQQLLELSIKRVDEIKARVRIGRSRQSDMFSAQAQVATAQAQVQSAETALSQARDVFAQTTGLAAETSLDEKLGLPSTLEPLSSLMKKIDDRPDVRAQKLQLEAAEEATKVAWGAHLPSVDLLGDYYLERSNGSGYAPNTPLSKWDVTLNVTFPIYAGGATQAQVRGAASQERQALLGLESLRRAGEREIRSDYQATEGGLLQVEFLKKASEAAEKNYNAEERDYRLGLITNLDVLASLNTFIDAKRQYDRAQSEVKISWLSLQAALGQVNMNTGGTRQ